MCATKGHPTLGAHSLPQSVHQDGYQTTWPIPLLAQATPRPHSIGNDSTYGAGVGNTRRVPPTTLAVVPPCQRMQSHVTPVGAVREGTEQGCVRLQQCSKAWGGITAAPVCPGIRHE